MLNAADFPTLQAAYDALPLEGGEIYLPARPDATGHVLKYVLTDSLQITKPVRFLGDGRNATIIVAEFSGPPGTMFDIKTSFVHFEKLTIDMACVESPAVPIAPDAVLFTGKGSDSTDLCQGCTMREVEVRHAWRNALRLIDVIIFDATDCSFDSNQDDGLCIDVTEDTEGTTALRFINCTFRNNLGRGAGLPENGSSVTFFGCVFEANEGGAGAADACGLSANAVFRLELISCYFEKPPASCEQFVYFNGCHAVVVENCVFFGNVSPTGPERAAAFENCAFPRFANNTAQRMVTEMVRFGSECNGGVEFGNRDLDASPARIDIIGRGVLSHSSGATTLGRFYNDNRPPVGETPGTALGGSMLWRLDTDVAAGESPLQISDGSDWRNIPVLRTIRRTQYLSAISLRGLNGSNTLADQGTYPDRYSYVAWAGNATVRDGMGTQWMVPYDLAATSGLTFSAIWSYDTLGTDGQTWKCEVNFLQRANNESMTSSGTLISAVIDAERGAPNSVFFDTIGTSTPGVLISGRLLRLTVNRNAPDSSDNYPGQVRFIGLLIEYSAGS